MDLFVVGEVLGDPTDPENDSWLFTGVFDSVEEALEHCRAENYFIGPVNLNKPFPEGRNDWEGAFYPSERGLTCIYD